MRFGLIFFCSLFLFILTYPSWINAQNSHDSNWYLVKSPYLLNMNPVDSLLLDTFMVKYHKESSNEKKMQLLDELIENCNNDNIWPLYNEILYTLSLKDSTKLLYLKFKGSALNNFGYRKLITGDIKSAIYYYSHALSLREIIKDSTGIANSLNNLAYVFDELRDFNKTEEYYKKALAIRRKLKDYIGLVVTLNNLGSYYNSHQNNTLFYQYTQEALSIARKINFKKGIAHSTNNLGAYYREIKNYPLAIEYQTEALQLRKELNDDDGIATTYYDFATIYLDMNKKKEAEYYALLSLDICIKADFPERERDIYLLLYNYFKIKNDYKNALNMHEKYISTRDKIVNQSAKQAGTRQQFKYEYELKESAIKSAQEKKDLLIKEEKKKQTIILLSVSSAGLLLLFLAVIVIRSNIHKQKFNSEIIRQKYIVEQKQKEILDSIRYAQRIQQSLLTSAHYIHKTLRKLKK